MEKYGMTAWADALICGVMTAAAMIEMMAVVWLVSVISN